MTGTKNVDELNNIDRRTISNLFIHKDFENLFKYKNEIIGLEYNWIGEKGEVIYVRENTKLIKDITKEVEYIEGTIEDITEQKIAEKRISSTNC